MKNRKQKNNILAIFFIIILVLISVYIKNNFIYNINKIKTGEYIEELSSPNNEWTIKSYLIKGDSLIADCTRVELVNNKTNEKKNIYYGYRENEVIMVWIDNKTVEINDIVLNIHKDTYDWRKER